MNVVFEKRNATHPKDAKGYDTTRLREEYLVDGLFTADTVKLTYSQVERFIVIGIMPVKETVKLDPVDSLMKAEYFLERRELGIINVGGAGTVVVDGEEYDINFKEALYVGKGSHEILFKSKDASSPAKFYCNSAPAHATYPTKLITRETAKKLELGSAETSNHRIINQLIINGVVDTCQLQMGITELQTGSVWNTMPAHLHDRRNEVYFYFEVPEGQAICHYMGDPKETRHIWLQNDEAVISPEWSIHSAAGTSNYSFIWGMAGENLDYTDMDFFQPNELK